MRFRTRRWAGAEGRCARRERRCSRGSSGRARGEGERHSQLTFRRSEPSDLLCCFMLSRETWHSRFASVELASRPRPSTSQGHVGWQPTAVGGHPDVPERCTPLVAAAQRQPVRALERLGLEFWDGGVIRNLCAAFDTQQVRPPRTTVRRL